VEGNSASGLDGAFGDGTGQERNDVIGGQGQLRGQGLLALQQSLVGLVALEEVDVARRVIADAGDQLDAVGQLDEIVVGPKGEGLGLGGRLLPRGEDDERNVLQPGMGRKNLTSVSPSMSA